MAAARSHSRHRAVTVASLSAVCQVCGGYELVSLRRINDPIEDKHGHPCPHCWWDIPIPHLPMRQDSPRGTA